jgi:transposase
MEPHDLAECAETREQRKPLSSWELPDEMWEAIEPLVSEYKGTGRPRRVDLRRITAGIFYVLRTGIQWQAAPRELFGPPSTVYYYFSQWAREGVFEDLWAEALKCYDDLKGLEWKWQSVDGAMTKSPLAGAPRAEIRRIVANSEQNAAY